jgi:hypothetical protein
MPDLPGLTNRGSNGYAQAHESLAALIQDAADQFGNVANVLSEQYTALNNATNGLLDGTFPWTGQGSESFLQAWQLFGQYIQQLGQSCTDAQNSLNKMSSKIVDVENQEAWNWLLTIVGGILTVISFAAMISEFGLNPLADGFFALTSAFTEQEGADIVNAATDITEADTEAASELQQVEDELTNSPGMNTLSGNVPGSGGGLPQGISPINLNEMTLAIDDELGPEGEKLIEQELGPGSDGDGVFPEDQRIPYDPTGAFYKQMQPGSCIAASSRMVLEDFDIEMPEAYVRDVMGVDSADGGTIKNIPQGFKELGLETPYVYQENLTIEQLTTATEDDPAIVSIKVPGANGFHAVVVDSIQDGEVFIRDPAGSSYGVSIQDFLNLWKGKAVIPET